MKKNNTIKILSVLGTSVLTLAIVILILKIKKNKKQENNCSIAGGSWDKQNKICKIETPTTPVIITPTYSSTNYPVWKPNVLAGEISRNLEGVNFSTYGETAQKVIALTDKQLRLLYTYYNTNLAKDYPTMTQLFENEWDDWNGYYNMVVDRLRAIGLN